MSATTPTPITAVKFHVWAWLAATGKTTCVGSAAPGTCHGCGKTG